MRKSKDEFFLQVAKLFGDERSTCIRRHVGAVIVKYGIVLATGYNGVPCGIEHCETAGCLREQMGVPSGQRYELCRGAHAEQNAINNAARHGVSIDGATLYCTDYPCAMCAKSIVNSGIVRVVYVGGFDDGLASKMMANIEVVHLSLLKFKVGDTVKIIDAMDPEYIGKIGVIEEISKSAPYSCKVSINGKPGSWANAWPLSSLEKLK